MIIKDFLFKILVISLPAFSCKNNTSNEAVQQNADSTSKQTNEQPGNTTGTQDLQQLKESLGQLTPLTDDALKAALPSQLFGMGYHEPEISSGSGTKAITADYTISDSSSIRLEMVDCGGPAGEGIFVMQYLDLPEETGADEETTFATTTWKGYKAFESCMKARPGDCTFTFLHAKRFLVYLQGTHLGMEKLKEAAAMMKP